MSAKTSGNDDAFSIYNHAGTSHQLVRMGEASTTGAIAGDKTSGAITLLNMNGDSRVVLTGITGGTNYFSLNTEFLARLTPTKFGYGAAETNTIASGVITPTKSFIAVEVESGTTDNLDTITATNFAVGDIIIISTLTTGHTIGIRSAGNIVTPSSGATRYLTTIYGRWQGMWQGSNWAEMSFAQ